jgi:monoamine oxidase
VQVGHHLAVDPGLLSVFTALTGETAGPDAEAAARAVLPQLEPVWPRPRRRVERTGDAEPAGPAPARLVLLLAAGPVHAVRGRRGEREGNCHFAGEHTSLDYQGFMEGAAAEAIRAAREILADHGAGPGR